MNVCCTFPGKFGDLLWALPTVRAISRRVGEPVDLFIAKPFASITPLIGQQDYIGTCAAIDLWEVEDTAPISPRAPQIFDAYKGGYDAVYNLGYRGWPLPDVVRHTRDTAVFESASLGYDPLTEAELDLQTPWITAPNHFPYRWSWCYGFTDEYFELKYGIVELLERRPRQHFPRLPPVAVGSNPRWVTEAGEAPNDWTTSAQIIQGSDVFLGDCSALHVLAVAVGTPVVLMEPQEMRWNPVFYPLGMNGPQITIVRGTDGNPTFDARHVADTLQRILETRR